MYVYTIATYALTPTVASPSADMQLYIDYKRVLLFMAMGFNYLFISERRNDRKYKNISRLLKMIYKGKKYTNYITNWVLS